MDNETKDIFFSQIERAELIERIEIWLSKHSEPFYEKGPLGETDTIKSDEFCPALADFILEDRKRILKPLVKLGSLDGQPLPTYEELCYAIEITLKNAGI